MFVDFFYLPKHLGYIAGTGNGIVSTPTRAAARMVYALDAETLSIECTGISNSRGQYLLPYLDRQKSYLLMARDFTGVYEPVCYDHITPASDKTFAQLQELWQQMQTP